MVISYDGTKYCGWQIQPHSPSIQGVIQKALLTAIREPISITASGRTDAGVHAIGQVAHFETKKQLNLNSLLYSLNGILPKEIRIRSIEAIDENFHARYSATAKIYRYYINLSSTQSPFQYPFSTHIHSHLDLVLMKSALQYFIGTHNFSSFSSSGCGSNDPVKTLFYIEIVPNHEGIYIEVCGNGFLYKMVRNIVGTLIEIGQKKRLPSDIPKLILTKTRSLSGPTAPSKGLFLYEVQY